MGAVGPDWGESALIQGMYQKCEERAFRELLDKIASETEFKPKGGEMPLYEVAVMSKPSKNNADNGVGQAIVYGPKSVVAADTLAAAFKAGSDAGPTLGDIEVLVRPFVKA